MQLKHRHSKKRVNILCAHLKAYDEYSEKRTAQTEFLLNILKETIVDKTDIETELRNQPIIICGDFNGDTHEPFYKLITNDNKNNRSQNNYAFSKSTDQPECFINLSDAYFSYREYNNNMFNKDRFKRHGTNNTKNVDYIFYTKSTLKLINYLNLDPDSNEINYSRTNANRNYPSLSYPSDHLSLVCDFQFN
jgi:nocturnin